MVFHYIQLINALIKKRKEDKIVQCCRYQDFVFLHDAFAIGIKKVPFSLFENRFPRHTQLTILKMFNELCSQEIVRMTNRGVSYSNTRIIQVALCLFYMEHNDSEFIETTANFIIKDLKGLSHKTAEKIINSTCEQITDEPENSWEETDQGNRNIFYSPYKARIPELNKYLLSKTAVTV